MASQPWPTWFTPPQKVGVIERVCESFNVSRAEVCGADRRASVARIRWLAMVMLRDAGLSYLAIGRLLNRDHSTVMHGVRSYPNAVKRYPAFAERAQELRGK